MIVDFQLNNMPIEVNTEPDVMATNLLRDELGILSVRNKCSDFSCGNCLILVDDKPVFSCLIRAFELMHADVWTFEGISAMDEFSHIQQNMNFLCNLCSVPRSILIEATLRKNINPTKDEIEQITAIVKCSCNPRKRIFNAIQKSAIQRRTHLNGLEEKAKVNL